MYSTSTIPLACKDDLHNNCFSYLLTGGIATATPWVPLDHRSYPFIRIKNVPTIQLEFQDTYEKEFAEQDCDLFEGPGGQAIAFCVTEVQLGTGTWRADNSLMPR